VIFLLALAFAGLVGHALRMAYGTAPPAVAEAAGSASPGVRWLSIAAAAPLAVLVVLFGVHVPDQVSDLLQQATLVLTPMAGGSGR
jgi:hypothetical protein